MFGSKNNSYEIVKTLIRTIKFNADEINISQLIVNMHPYFLVGKSVHCLWRD